jgi:glutaredoxin
MTKEFFAEHNITYTEQNVATDQSSAQEMINKSGQMGVPVTIISEDGKDELVVGFDEERLSALLVVTA